MTFENIQLPGPSLYTTCVSLNSPWSPSIKVSKSKINYFDEILSKNFSFSGVKINPEVESFQQGVSKCKETINNIVRKINRAVLQLNWK